MKKLIFISLLVVPFCKAASFYLTDFSVPTETKETADYERAYNSAKNQRWGELYGMIDKGRVGVNEVLTDFHRPLEPFLNLAIYDDNFDVIEELIKKGADPNILGRYFELPLQMASTQYIIGVDNMPSIKLLLESGANPLKANRRGENAFQFIDQYHVFGADEREKIERKKKLTDLFEEYLGMIIKPAKR